jgi:hypothetical protein
MKNEQQIEVIKVNDVNRGECVRINNPNSDGLPLLITIPSGMVFLIDVVLREMCHRGNTSPELRIYHVKGGTGQCMWNCEFGAIRTWSVTPWGALEAMGRQLASLIAERENG